MSADEQNFRLTATTALHRGDRAYQQDQVQIIQHGRSPGCLLCVLADGMGGKSGGRKAADQVLLTAQQLFERYVPYEDEPATALEQIVQDAHLMIKLTAMSAEEEPHSTVAAFLLSPDLRCDAIHAGDSRIYHFRGADLVARTVDHSFVQRLIDDGKLTEEAANTHPQSNLLTGCLGTHNDPPLAHWSLGTVKVGDTLFACSDGLWHYFTPKEIGSVLHVLPPREAAEMLITKARQRARGGGDNLSLALVRIDPLG